MKKLSKKQKNIYLALAVALSVVAGFIHWTQADNSGEIKQSNPSAQKIPDTSIKQFEGKHTSFTYSGLYRVNQRTASGDDLELYEFDADKPYVKKVAVSVSQLPDGTLNSNSAYLLRKSHTDKFFERKLTPTIPNTEIWSSTDGTKQTVFITNGGKVAIFAFTQDGGDKTLYNNEVDAIIRSFKWTR